LFALWPSYLAFVTSFITILVIWVHHHWIFTLIRRSDHPFLYLNGLLLLFVTFVPFPTALLADICSIPKQGWQQTCIREHSLRFHLLLTCFGDMRRKDFWTQMCPMKKKMRPPKSLSSIGLVPLSILWHLECLLYPKHGALSCVCCWHCFSRSGAGRSEGSRRFVPHATQNSARSLKRVSDTETCSPFFSA
jgi:hypothetical protein